MTITIHDVQRGNGKRCGVSTRVATFKMEVAGIKVARGHVLRFDAGQVTAVPQGVTLPEYMFAELQCVVRKRCAELGLGVYVNESRAGDEAPIK